MQWWMMVVVSANIMKIVVVRRFREKKLPQTSYTWIINHIGEKIKPFDTNGLFFLRKLLFAGTNGGKNARSGISEGGKALFVRRVRRRALRAL